MKRLPAFAVAMVLVGVVLLGTAQAAVDPFVARVVYTYESAGLFDTVAVIERGAAAGEVARRYKQVIQYFYWKKKDVEATAYLSIEGIAFCRHTAAVAKAAGNTGGEKELLGVAKAMAYNLSSFTWPGWGGDSPKVPAHFEKLGRQAAGLNLRLATELAKEPIKVAMAHWLVGAHEMTAGQFAAATASFNTYKSIARRAGGVDHAFVADAYLALNRRLAGQDAAEADAAFGKAVKGLKQLESRDGDMFAAQMADVRAALVDNANTSGSR
jgi:hypothetical protein